MERRKLGSAALCNSALKLDVRDAANNPVNGSVVVLGYADCPTFAPCPAAGPPIDDYLVDYGTKTLRTTTNAAGQAIFHLRAGGGCQVYPITIFADGVFLAASTDQNGNGIVDAIDVIILTAKVGGSDLTGDLDCDGVVDNYDLSIQDGSLGSARPTVNPTRETSWGRVKTIYR